MPDELDRSISDDRLRALAEYLTLCQTAMSLDEWDLRLKLDRRPSEDEAMAQISVTRNRYQASVFFAEEFFDAKPEEQRIVVCHELVHLIADPLDIVLYDGHLATVFGTATWQTITGPLSAALERVVDRMSTLLAPLLPLPDLDGSKA